LFLFNFFAAKNSMKTRRIRKFLLKQDISIRKFLYTLKSLSFLLQKIEQKQGTTLANDSQRSCAKVQVQE